VFDIGDFIRRKRAETGESQAALATAIRVGNESIIRWEAGRTVPGDEYLRRLEEHWGLEPEWRLAQKFLNIMEDARIDPRVIVEHAPDGGASPKRETRAEKSQLHIDFDQLIRAENWEAVINLSIRQMRSQAFSRAVHAFEDSVPADELERALRDAGIEYQRATDPPDPPTKRGRKK
jgi:transcriptional regulator with XRE-family HTH domain